MAKRKKKTYRPQPMAQGISERFQALMKPKGKIKSFIDRKYSEISINPFYQEDDDLKL